MADRGKERGGGGVRAGGRGRGGGGDETVKTADEQEIARYINKPFTRLRKDKKQIVAGTLSDGNLSLRGEGVGWGSETRKSQVFKQPHSSPCP